MVMQLTMKAFGIFKICHQGALILILALVMDISK